MKSVQVLLTGDTGHREFREAVNWLTGQARVVLCPKLEGAVEWLATAEVPPFAIVVAQSRPGQFSQGQIERLHEAAPLARIVALLGSWCEGETRSGWPWPGVIRVYWHQWSARTARELAGPRAGQCGTWNLPRTATADERLLKWADQPLSRSPGVVAICTGRSSAFEALADACQAAGYRAVRFGSHQGATSRQADVVLWDDASGEPNWCRKLQGVVARARPAPVLALLDFPRLEDHHRAICAGASQIVSKPFLLADLDWHLGEAMKSGCRRDDVSAA